MHKSTLLEILRTFSKQELIKFEDFVESPYFNKKENVIRLVIQVKKYFPGFDDDALKKENIWSNIFPGKEYNYGIMKNLIFDLNKLAEQFISQLKFDKDIFKEHEYLLTALCDRELNKIYITKYKAFTPDPDLKIINENNLQAADHMNYVYKMYYLNSAYQHQYDQDYNLEELSLKRDSTLVAHFLILLFSSYNDAAAIANYKKTDIENNPSVKLLNALSPHIESIIKSLHNSHSGGFSFVNIYHLMYRVITERTKKRYMEFKKLLFENTEFIPKTNLQDFHYYLLNSLNIIELEDLSGHEETIEVMDSLISHNALTDIKNDKLALHVFNKYVTNCFMLKDAVKLKSFADRFTEKLEPEHRGNAGNDVNFMISFINKNFNEALNYLSLLEIPYVSLKLIVRCEKAQCMYELNDYEMFLNEYDNTKHFISNNAFLTEGHKTQLNNIFSHIKQLFNLRQNFREYEYQQLKKDVEETYKNNVLWFNEKLDELVA